MSISPLVVEIFKQFAIAAAPAIAQGLAEGFYLTAKAIVEDDSISNDKTVELLQELLELRNLTITIALEK